MAKKKGGKGGSGLVGTITGWVISLAMIGVVLAGLQMLGTTNVDSALNKAKEKAVEYSKCVPSGECGLMSIFQDFDLPEEGLDLVINGPKVERPKDTISLPEREGLKFNLNELLVSREDKGYLGPDRGEPFVTASGLVNKDDSQKMLAALRIVPDNVDDKADVGYSRKEWKHWISLEGRSCWNTREEVLSRDAVKGSLSLIDKEKKQTTDIKKACAIGKIVKDSDRISIETKKSGKWIDPYSGKTMEDSSDLDIDHIIPLSNAARNGGQKWSTEEKEKFANDLDNLLVTSAKENRAKGDKGPAKYMPPNKNYQCQYAKSYTTLAYKYDLSITKSDQKVLDKTIKSCGK